MTTQTTRDELTTEEFRDRLQQWLKDNDFEEATIRSDEEWIARGETMGGGSRLHLTSEGALNTLVNYGWELGEYTEILDDFVHSLGWHMEQGYSWSWHFMPLSQFDAESDPPA